jgi:integrase/recombinase XerD
MTEAALELQPVETIIRVMLTPSRALDNWLDDLERRDFSAKTITDYNRIIGLLVDELPRDLDVSKITLDAHLRPFLHRYRTRSKNTKATIEAAICSFFNWLYFQGKITRDPCDLLVRTRRPAAEELDVVTVSTDDVRRMLLLAEGWPERLAVHILAYLGPRRHAVSQLRFTDYDRARGQIRFREKGGKVIYKPIPDPLDLLLEQAIAAGVYESQDYLVPSLRPGQVAKGRERNDQIIWLLVKRVAKRAGVNCHVHALRAAFACFYLEASNGDVNGLRLLLGHKNLTTTQIYLRKQNKQQAMEPVRGLSWGVADPGKPSVQDSRTLRGKVSGTARMAARDNANARKGTGGMGTGRDANSEETT